MSEDAWIWISAAAMYALFGWLWCTVWLAVAKDEHTALQPSRLPAAMVLATPIWIIPAIPLAIVCIGLGIYFVWEQLGIGWLVKDALGIKQSSTD